MWTVLGRLTGIGSLNSMWIFLSICCLIFLTSTSGLNLRMCFTPELWFCHMDLPLSSDLPLSIYLMRRICNKKLQVWWYQSSEMEEESKPVALSLAEQLKHVADSESTDASLDPDPFNVPSISYLQYLSNIAILSSEKQLTVRGK